MNIDVDVSIKELEKQIKALDKKFDVALERGAKIGAIAMIGIMMRDAPVKTGLLRSSGSVWFNGKMVYSTPRQGRTSPKHPSSVSLTKTKTDRVDATFGFNTSYAMEQDTRRDLAHPKGGKAGYFTDNFKSQRKNTLLYMVQEVQKEMARG